MRFVLNNKNKLDNGYLTHNVLPSLRAFFNRFNEHILGDFLEVNGYIDDWGIEHHILRINDVADENSMLEFIVDGIHSDLWIVHFMGRLKG